MRRRALLGLAAGTLAGLAGCNDAPGQGTTDTPDAGTGTPEAPTLAVDVDPLGYYVTTFQPSRDGGVDPDAVVPEDGIPEALRDPLREALAGDGTFETDSASDDLLAAVDEFREYGGAIFRPFVRLDETPYLFDPTIPTFVGELGDSTDEVGPDDDRVARVDAEFESEAVDQFVRTVAMNGLESPRLRYQLSVVPEEVEAFLEEYDYIADPLGVAPIETEWLNTQPPFSIRLRELTDEDFWGRPVLEAADLDTPLREFLVAAVESADREPVTASPEHTEYLTDDVPGAYFEAFTPRGEDGSRPYVRLDGTVYRVDVQEIDHDRVPVELDVEPASSTSDGTPLFTLSVRVTTGDAETDAASTGAVELQSPGGLPSVLWVDDGEGRRLLESDAYDHALWETVPDDPAVDERITGVVEETVDLGESIGATYAVPPTLAPGEYVSPGAFGARWQPADADEPTQSVVPFAVTLTLDSA